MNWNRILGRMQDIPSAAPESETPETDEFSNPSTEGDNDSFVAIEHYNSLLEHARSLERRLSLAQTEIKGHMRTEDDLKRDISIYKASIEKFAMQHHRKVMGLEARIAELEKDAARLDYLERELEMEQEQIQRGKGTDPMYPSLFRRNNPITRAAIDAALKSRA